MPLALPSTGATLGAWLGYAEKLYAQHKVALGQVAVTVHDEALYLLLHALGLPLDSSAAVLRRKVTITQASKLVELLRRR